MASIPANNPPPKPWERAGCPSSSTPFRLPSAAGSTSDVVEASGTARPGEIVGNSDRNATIKRNAIGRPVPVRPWEQNYGSINYGGMYGSYGGIGGMFGNSSYQGGYGGFCGPGIYGGGGIYNGGFGGPLGGYQIGMASSYGAQDPNDPSPPPPGFWISVLRMQRVVNCFGRISILIDQNAQAFHMFMTALLQLFDRSGRLYGELARFVLRLLGFRSKLRKVKPPGLDQHLIEEPKAAPAASGSWDNVWENNAEK